MLVDIEITEEAVMNKIYYIRGHKIMLDSVFAELYGVETKQLKRQVRRNIDRFPPDFMFELTKEELEILRSQFGTLGHGEHMKYLPMVFTEHGVLMLSSVLNSKQAIAVNIQIMRVFTKLRQFLTDNSHVQHQLTEMRLAIEQMAKKQKGHDQNIELLFEYIDRLQEKLETPTPTERKRIGYEVGKKEEKKQSKEKPK